MKLSQTTVVAIIVIALIIGIIGCGGSGVSFSSAEKDAVFANSVASHQSLEAGINVGFVSLKETSPTGSGLKLTTKIAQAVYNKSSLRRIVPSTGRAATLDFIPFLGLYINSTTALNVRTTHFFSDAGGTDNAGDLTTTITGATSFDTNYSSYPVTIQAAVNLTKGKIPMTGNLAIVYQDSAGANTMKGSLTLPSNNIIIAIDMGLTHAQLATGQVTVTTPNNTFVLSNVTGNPFSTLSGNVAIQPQGWTGTAAFTPVTGQFAMELITPQGKAHAVLGLDGKLIVTYPDGDGSTVNDPSGSSLNRGGNGSTTSTTSTTATTATTATTSTTATNGSTAGTYSDPIQLVSSSQTFTSVVVSGSNPNGNAIGYEMANGSNLRQAVYWTNATMVTELQKPTADASVTPNGVNNNGEIVGESLTATSNSLPIYYASPLSAPVFLKVPQNTSTGTAHAINSSGAIVGYYIVNSTKVAAYWADKTADPVQLPQGSFGTPQTVKFIDDAGEMFGDDTSKFFKWDNSTATPVAMSPGTGSNQTYLNGVTPGGVAFGGYINSGGNGDHPGIWANGSHNVTDVNFVIGFTDALISSSNASGTLSGYQRSASNVVSAWVKVGSSPVSLQGLVNNAGGWTFVDAKFVDSSSNLYVLAGKNNAYKWVYLKKN
jgi:hypothetical protein